MEYLLSKARPDSFTHTCLTEVVAKMMVLLQQQSELCRDLETLTLVTPDTGAQDSHTPPTRLPRSHSDPPPYSATTTNPTFSTYSQPTSPVPMNSGDAKTPTIPNVHSTSSAFHIVQPTTPPAHTSHPVAITSHPVHTTPTTGNIIQPTPISPHPPPAEVENIVPLAHSSPAAPQHTPGTSHTPPHTPNSPRPSSRASVDTSWNLRRIAKNGEEGEGGEERDREQATPLTPPYHLPEVAQLVEVEVRSRTSGLQQQLLQQTQDVADIKGMLHVLLSRLK